MGRDWVRRARYRPGDAESDYDRFQFRKRELREAHLAAAVRLATEGKNRMSVRDLHGLHGEWKLEQGQWVLVAESLHEAVRMARGVNTIDAMAESHLALARFHLCQLTDPRREAEQLAQARHVDDQALADLWACHRRPRASEETRPRCLQTSERRRQPRKTRTVRKRAQTPMIHRDAAPCLSEATTGSSGIAPSP